MKQSTGIRSATRLSKEILLLRSHGNNCTSLSLSRSARHRCSFLLRRCSSLSTQSQTVPGEQQRPGEGLGPSLKDFIKEAQQQQKPSVVIHEAQAEAILLNSITSRIHPYVPYEDDDEANDQNSTIIQPLPPRSLRYMIETYGCQMNVNDSDIVRSILNAAGHTEASSLDDADIIFENTCSIRENAENKIWHRLDYIRHLRRDGMLKKTRARGYPKVGVLGCMAERLKTKLLEQEGVDLVVGPDAYRSLPALLQTVTENSRGDHYADAAEDAALNGKGGDQKACNVQLSLDETYADIAPVRRAGEVSAFVSVMRGCNNMCSFCVVPFTRGRERSRDLASIQREVRELAAQGVKELVLLGQNVNGYHDTSPASAQLFFARPLDPNTTVNGSDTHRRYQTSSPGFVNLFQSRSRDLPGARFADLLQAVAEAAPEARVRFTSPHPKDFPEPVLRAVARLPNVCKALHLPAQSGSSSALQRMRRNYSREAYLQLVEAARDVIGAGRLTISTDVIAGFCGETEAEHEETLSLMRAVQFDQAFMFAYSRRDRTHAAYNLTDDVPEQTKLRRLQEIISTFRSIAVEKNRRTETGQLRLVLVEGPSTRASGAKTAAAFGQEASAHLLPGPLTGRTDGNKRVVFQGVRDPRLSSGPAPSTSSSSGERMLLVPDFHLVSGRWRGQGGPEACEASVAARGLVRRLTAGAGVEGILSTSNSSSDGSSGGFGAGAATTASLLSPESILGSNRREYPCPEVSSLSPESLCGRYVVVQVLEAGGTTLRGVAVGLSTLGQWHADGRM